MPVERNYDPDPLPKVGDTVDYHPTGVFGQTSPAVSGKVTAVISEDGRVINLTMDGPKGPVPIESACYEEVGPKTPATGNVWHWPVKTKESKKPAEPKQPAKPETEPAPAESTAPTS